MIRRPKEHSERLSDPGGGDEVPADSEEPTHREAAEPDASDLRLDPKPAERPRVRDDDENCEHEPDEVERVVAARKTFPQSAIHERSVASSVHH